jgi:hypothetical protein
LCLRVGRERGTFAVNFGARAAHDSLAVQLVTDCNEPCIA